MKPVFSVPDPEYYPMTLLSLLGVILRIYLTPP